jgi:subtilisin-like proprotein convertase family protein
MKKALELALAAGMCCALSGVAAAQTTFSSTTTPVAILDTPTIDNSIVVSGSGIVIGDLDVRINITHTFDSDLDMVLLPPGGAEYIHLATDVGGGGDNFVNTVFDQDSGTAITAGVAPFTGNFRPEGGVAAWIGTIPLTGLTALTNLDSVNNRPADGTWTLRIDDDAGGDVGTLNSWALIVTAIGGPTNPVGTSTLAPTSGTVGATTLATVTVVPGTFPPSTGITVVANASTLDAGSVALLDNGIFPDASAGDNIFTANIIVGANAALGAQNVVFTIDDEQVEHNATTATSVFTVNPPPSPNDACTSPEVIPVASLPYASGPSFIFGNVRAPELGMSCSAGGATNINSSVWYSITPTQDGNYRFTTSQNLATGNNIADTVIAIYSSADGTCGSLTEIACDDDGGVAANGNELQSDKTVALTAGTTYFVQVAKWALTAPTAANTLGIWVDLPNTAPVVDGGFAPFVNVNNCGSAVTLVTAAVTPGGNPTSTELQVTADLTALGGSSNTQLFDDGTNGDVTQDDNIFSLSYTVPASAVLGLSQPIFTVTDAQGRSSTDTGDITIVACPTGACCTGTSCTILTEADCLNAGGTYMGDNVGCTNGDGYVFSDSTNALEDISGTGTNLGLTDDSNANALIGFNFTYFGNSYSDVFVSSNGFLSFGAGSSALGNGAIPSAGVPNNALYAMWDDLNPGAAGGVFYQTLGTSGVDLRFIVQWNAVPQFGGTDSNTFQVVLFENGDVEYRYAAISVFTDADATVGAENADGTAATSVAASSIGSNTAKRLAFMPGGPVCSGPSCAWQADGCFADYDNSGGIDGDDVIAFFGDWDGSLECADTDASGGVDGDDVINFFAAWDAGGISFPGCE